MADAVGRHGEATLLFERPATLRVLRRQVSDCKAYRSQARHIKRNLLAMFATRSKNATRGSWPYY